ncbi:YadA-like family protein [Frateuria defendens]|uniref:YadA-like family protein n=1 Tax=Frateuria defendens TaxID=2219559 RepID=UPI00066FD478|nr:YadA-like family protein [Frateuria defendens]
MEQALGQANRYTDQRTEQLWTRVDQFRREANQGIASAAALAGNMPSVPGKVAVSAGVATYRGQGAVAVSVSRWSGDGRINLNAGVSSSGSAPVIRFGVGLILGD